MKIQSFTSLFSKEILQRGKRYYEQGRVQAVEQVTKLNWQAEVSGSDLYVVDITLNARGGITYMDCDCLYDDYCKHMVAVLLAIKEQPEQATSTKKNFKQLLQQQTKDELIQLIIELSKKHRAFKKELEFAITPKQDDLQSAASIIQHYIDLATGRDHFISRRDAEQAVQGIEIVHNYMMEHIDNGRYVVATDLALLCIEKGMELLQYGDDSDGDLGGAVEESIHLLGTCIEQMPNNTDEGAQIFSKLVQLIKGPILKGFPDWQIDVIYAGLPLCKQVAVQEQLNDVLRLIEDMYTDGWTCEYVRKATDKIRHQLYTENLSVEDTERYLQQHPEAEDLRVQLIQAAIDREDFMKVQQLAEQGLHVSNAVYVTTQWEKYLFIACRELQQLEKARQLAEQLLLKGHESYYAELYDLYDDTTWAKKQQQLLNVLAKQQPYVYEKIIVNENLVERLLQLCQQRRQLIRQYYHMLTPHYEEEVAQIFTEQIVQEASHATNRSQYRAVCELLRTMQKAGYTKKVTALIDTFKQQFNKRPAFLDELGNIK